MKVKPKAKSKASQWPPRRRLVIKGTGPSKHRFKNIEEFIIYFAQKDVTWMH